MKADIYQIHQEKSANIKLISRWNPQMLFSCTFYKSLNYFCQQLYLIDIFISNYVFVLLYAIDSSCEFYNFCYFRHLVNDSVWIKKCGQPQFSLHFLLWHEMHYHHAHF